MKGVKDYAQIECFNNATEKAIEAFEEENLEAFITAVRQIQATLAASPALVTQLDEAIELFPQSGALRIIVNIGLHVMM